MTLKSFFILLQLLLISISTTGQEFFNFYLEPHPDQDKIVLHTVVYRKPLTFLGGIQTSSAGNVLDVSLCYQNSSSIGTTWDHQTFTIDLPNGFSNYEMNLSLFGDDDGAPCELTNLVDSDVINFDYPYNPTDFINIPDNYFELYLENTLSGDGSINGIVPTHKIENVSSVFLDDSLFIIDPIASIEGIENFSRLRVLNFEDNNISGVDLSNNLNLEQLICSLNNLDQLDVSVNTGLKLLWSGFNNFTQIDISNNTLLENLALAENGLTEIDLTQNINLKYLSIGGENLNGLNLNNNVLLEDLIVGNANFPDLDLSNNLELRSFHCDNSMFEQLDFSANLLLQEINCQSNSLQNVDVSGLTSLTRLYLIDNNLQELDVSSNTSLQELSVLFNDLHDLNVRNGNNENMTTMLAMFNPNLYCVQVDDEDQAPYPGWGVDPQTVFSEDCSLDISTSEIRSIEIYPNPVSRKVFIDNITADVYLLQLIDSRGSIIIEKTPTKATTELTLDLEALESGLYLLRVFTAIGVSNRKILKK